jgi:hypothetical protein
MSTTLPRKWATDAAYSSGIDSGTSPRTDPGAGISAQGFLPHEGVPAQHLNHILGTITDSLHAIDSIDYAEIREDFIGAAIDDSGSSLLTAPQSLWRTNVTFSPAINHRPGNAKNPGLLECSIPTDAGGCVYEFHAGGTNTGAPITYYQSFQLLEVVLKIEEDAANISESIRFGLVDNAGAENGGSDCLCLWRNKGVNASKWLLLKRVSGVQTNTVLTAADFVDGEFAVWRLEKNSAGGIDISLNGTVVHVVDFIALPAGGANLSFWQSTGGADTELLTVTYDLIRLRTFPSGLSGDRSGA